MSAPWYAPGNLTTAEAIAIMSSWTLISEPGTKLTYSNMGFALLGRLMEQVDSPSSPKGESWEDSVDRLARVLGMTHTTARAPADTSNLAHGLQYDLPAPLVDLGWGNPCGSMYSTANDMAKLMSFILRCAQQPRSFGCLFLSATF
jgi:CubicO group peptidase (beta-lactamase class C family)